MKEGELEFVILQKAKMRRLLRELFPEIVQSTTEERLAFDKIFQGYEEFAANDTDKERMMRIIQNMERYHQSPGSDDIEFVLRVFSGSGEERMKKLLTDL